MRPVVRMLIVGAIGFAAAELLYGSRGPDTGAVQFILYGLVGFVPATLSSWLAHEICRGAAGGHHDVGRASGVITRSVSDDAIHVSASGEMDDFASLAKTASSGLSPRRRVVEVSRAKY